MFQNEPFLVAQNDSSGAEGDDGGGHRGYKGFIIDLMDEVTKDMDDVDYEERGWTVNWFFLLSIKMARSYGI